MTVPTIQAPLFGLNISQVKPGVTIGAQDPSSTNLVYHVTGEATRGRPAFWTSAQRNVPDTYDVPMDIYRRGEGDTFTLVRRGTEEKIAFDPATGDNENLVVLDNFTPAS